MELFLKRYEMRIRALAPIHIGDDGCIGKKEYICQFQGQKILVPRMETIYRELEKQGKAEAFYRYFMGKQHSDLGSWLRQEGFCEADFKRWKRYELDAGEAFWSAFAGRKTEIEGIDTFVKDAYGMPYVPGSSIKGLFRTALLVYGEKHHPNQYGLDKILSGLIVGDSHPIRQEQLVLCQSIDYTLSGEEKKMPFLREALAPGTEIDFEVTIDPSVFPYTVDELFVALNEFQEACYQHFYSRFHRGTAEANRVWLGRGVGFATKTVYYALYGSEAVPKIDTVFRKTLGYRYKQHNHTKDLAAGVAPHVCKCTRYRGQLYDMGLGEICLLNSPVGDGK